MPVQLFTNNATTLLDADIGTGDTTLAVTAGDGALFPLPTAGDWFYATIQSGALIEIVQVTTRATDDFSVIVRAQEGTSAIAFSAGATIDLRVTAAFLDSVRTTDTDPTLGDVSGPAGGVLDDELCVYDSTTGKLIKASGVGLADLGDVVGPAAGVVDNEVCFFDSTTGKLIKGSGLTLAGSNTGDQTLPIDSTITVTDNTGNDATTSAHGWMPKGTGVARHFFNASNGQGAIPGLEVFDPVVNPGMNLWQRATTFTGLTTADMLADQYEIEFVSSAGVMDASQVTPAAADIHTPSGQRINHALRIDVTTLDASVAAGEFVTIGQKIEGYRAAPFMHNEFTVSFFARSNLTGQFALAVGNDSDDRNFIKTWSPASADVWERFSITVPVQDLTGTWDYQNDIGLYLRWTLQAGTDHDGTDDTWNSTADFAVAGTENFLSSTSNYIELTGVQIDMGPDAKEYRGTPFETDIQAAQRYFTKSYNHDVDPATVTATGEWAVRAHSTNHREPIRYKVEMRANPTVVHYNPTTGVVAEWRDVSGTSDVAAATVSPGMSGFEGEITAIGDGNRLIGHWTAEARL